MIREEYKNPDGMPGKLDTQADNTANQRAPFIYNRVFLLSFFVRGSMRTLGKVCA
jgi:hypothetical protein